MPPGYRIPYLPGSRRRLADFSILVVIVVCAVHPQRHLKIIVLKMLVSLALPSILRCTLDTCIILKLISFMSCLAVSSHSPVVGMFHIGIMYCMYMYVSGYL